MSRTLPFAALLVTLVATTLATPAMAAGALQTTVILDDNVGAGRAARDGIVGWVVVKDDDGAVVDAAVKVIIIRKVDPIGNIHNQTIEGVTGSNGAFEFSPNLLFSAPGEYFVIVRVTAGEQTSQVTTTYTVG